MYIVFAQDMIYITCKKLISFSDKDGFNACDILTVLALAVPDSVVEVRNWRATVELHGALTRGQLIVDKRAQQGMKANQITIITKFDVEKLCDVVIKMLDD